MAESAFERIDPWYLIEWLEDACAVDALSTSPSVFKLSMVPEPVNMSSSALS